MYEYCENIRVERRGNGVLTLTFDNPPTNAFTEEIHVQLRLWSADTAAAEKKLDEIVERIRRALGETLFSTKGEEIEQVVAQQLTWHGATLAVAESCTGGMLGERLTRIPGSSAYFVGGVISYGNDLKSGWLDVPREVIESKGAVSAEAARAKRRFPSAPTSTF